jgi:hypothetical protein
MEWWSTGVMDFEPNTPALQYSNNPFDLCDPFGDRRFCLVQRLADDIYEAWPAVR